MSVGVEGEPSQLLTGCGAQRGRPSQSLSWDTGKPSEGGPQAPMQGREHHSTGACVSVPARHRDFRQQLSSLICKPHGLIGLE